MSQQIIDQTAEYVKSKLMGEGSGHDWWHIERVWKMAKKIAAKEKADSFIVELGALLHDISDWKFNDGDETVGPRIAGEWLTSLGVEKNIITTVQEIIEDVSFKGAGHKKKVRSKEGGVVQDADRLDAMGAIGIARCFAYGGYKSREIYNPNIKPSVHKTAQEYKTSVGTSLNHFHEKLLLLKDLMNTQTARKIAVQRDAFMRTYLDQFMNEWDAKV